MKKDVLKENPDSEYRAITWAESRARGVDRRYMIGDTLRVYEKQVNKYVDCVVYSIDETSYLAADQKFILRYTVSLVNNKGEVFDFYHIVNGTDITLMPNHGKIIHI